MRGIFHDLHYQENTLHQLTLLPESRSLDDLRSGQALGLTDLEGLEAAVLLQREGVRRALHGCAVVGSVFEPSAPRPQFR